MAIQEQDPINLNYLLRESRPDIFLIKARLTKKQMIAVAINTGFNPNCSESKPSSAPPAANPPRKDK
jgi:hypothetical protein